MALLLLASCRAADSPPGPDAESPNVVLISFCTLRADRLGAYEARTQSTPYLDGLASRSAVFLNHYTQASYSGGAFASILTGKVPAGHGIFDHPMRLADEHETIAELLRRRGYATAAFLTKSYLSKHWNFHQGFDTFETIGSPSQINEAILWMRLHRERKFFLWLESQVTHYPYEVPEPFRPQAHQAAFESFMARAGDLENARLMFDYAALDFSKEETDAALAFYEAAVAFSDALVGRILRALRELRISERTLVLVTADHGESLGEHAIYFNHDANLYDTTVRVPLLLHGPGIEPSRVRAVTRAIDLLPTICELAGCEVPLGVDGSSLVPALRGSDLALDAYAESRPLVETRVGRPNYHLRIPGVPGKLRMIRRGSHKLIAFPLDRSAARHELYDLAADPWETTNLAARDPALVAQLAGELEEWFQRYAAAEVPNLELTEEDRASLRALGYID